MEENETITAEYTKGFNEGYIISQHQAELAEKLAAAVGENDRGLGFKDGRKQLMLDLMREKRPKWLTRDLDNRSNTSEPEKTENKDLDIDLEPDI